MLIKWPWKKKPIIVQTKSWLWWNGNGVQQLSEVTADDLKSAIDAHSKASPGPPDTIICSNFVHGSMKRILLRVDALHAAYKNRFMRWLLHKLLERYWREEDKIYRDWNE